MEITLYNRQRKVRVPLARLQRRAAAALGRVFACPAGRKDAALAGLAEVEASFVSPAASARVHRQFMDVAGPTDVITFAHGEIVICPEVARANAPLYGRSLEEELALYVIHGLLHLHGYDDRAPAEAARMSALQEAILARLPAF